MLLGAHLGVVAQDEVAPGDGRAVLDRVVEEQAVEVGEHHLGVVEFAARPLEEAQRARVAEAQRGVGLEHRHLPFELLGVAPPVVAVADGDVAAAARLDGAAVVGPHADVVLRRYQTDAVGVARGVGAADVGRGVAAAVLAQEQLDGKRGALRQDALDGPGDVGGVVVGGHADRNKRSIHLSEWVAHIFSGPGHGSGPEPGHGTRDTGPGGTGARDRGAVRSRRVGLAPSPARGQSRRPEASA